MLCQGIKANNTLISLNLNGCNLDTNCGDFLVDAMENNFTIIHLDFGGNKLELNQKRQL